MAVVDKKMRKKVNMTMYLNFISSVAAPSIALYVLLTIHTWNVLFYDTAQWVEEGGAG